jgi:hypothetical protein
MKKKTSRALSLNKRTITNLPGTERVVGGAVFKTLNTCDYSQCGTGPATLCQCTLDCPSVNDPTCYSVCGTGMATLGPNSCCCW